LPAPAGRTYDPGLAVDDWNVLATSVEGARPVLLAGLRRHGAFRGAGYRNVAIGRVVDRPAFFAAFRDDLARDTLVAAAVGRVLPIDEVLQLTEDDPQASLEAAVTALAPRVTGSFFVRLERRGLHGTLHSSDVERTLGAALWRALESAGRTPRVTFRDPDLVVAIETLGPRAGIALVDRALRATYPFIRIR
jgi:tRNA(Ser,Leu) C12 N-acetylase TAN1